MSLSTRLTLVMVLLVAITAAAVGILSYRTIESGFIPQELSRLESRARLQAVSLNAHVAAARADLLSLSGQAALEGFVAAHSSGGKDHDGTPEEIWRDRLMQNFAAQMSFKPDYDEIRLVGVADGRELIRVDRTGPGGAIRVSTGDDQEPKADRGFFRAAIALDPGQVYLSPIMLSQVIGARTGGLRIPYLRSSTPIFDKAGKLFGVLVMNIDMRKGFEEIARAARPSGELFVVNDEGDYLVHSDPAREFGFNRGTRYRIQDDFPALAGDIAGGEPVSHMVGDTKGRQFASTLVPIRLGGGPLVYVVESVSREVALAAAGGVERATILGGLAAALAAAALAVLLARSLVKPLVQLSASFAQFTGEEEITVPVDATGEIGTLARAFDRMAKTVRERTAALQQEIAERRRAEIRARHIADRERLYVAAVESASDAIITSSQDGFITTWNAGAERMFGWIANEAIGQPISLIAPVEKRPEQFENLQRLRRGESLQDVETVRVGKDGVPHEVSLTLSPIANSDGVMAGVSAIYRDIAPRKHQERLLAERAEELQRSNAELEQFAYVASHDLQEPLRMVASYAELLGERYKGKLDEKADKYIGYAVDGAKRMQRLVNDLLAISRIGRHQATAVETDMNTVLAQVLKGCQMAIEQARAKIESEPLPVIVADAGQISQVFQNLIGNAVKFRGDKAPLIRVGAKRSGRGWLFSVEDNGIGIEQQYSERVFQMFQRLHDRQSYEGNGIGLTIAKKIVERHGGRIWFESEPGRGTTFYFTLAQEQEKAA